MYIPWLPHAGQTELTQVALAIWGTYLNARLLVHVGIDAVLARRDDPTSEDTDRVARASVYAQLTLTLIQLLVLVTGIVSLFLPPPPPVRFGEMWLSLDPRAVMWVVQHVGLMLTSLICVIGGHLAEKERKRIINPTRAEKQVRQAVQVGETVTGDVTLFQQLGGTIALAGVVDDLDARLFRDPTLAPYFTGVDVTRLKHAQVLWLTEFLQGAFAGGVQLREVHAHLSISDTHFTRFIEHFRDSLQFFGVSQDLRERILTHVESTRDQIVTRTPTP